MPIYVHVLALFEYSSSFSSVDQSLLDPCRIPFLPQLSGQTLPTVVLEYMRSFVSIKKASHLPRLLVWRYLVYNGDRILLFSNYRRYVP